MSKRAATDCGQRNNNNDDVLLPRETTVRKIGEAEDLAALLGTGGPGVRALLLFELLLLTFKLGSRLQPS